MMRVPLSYNIRSIFVRRSSSLLTIFGIAATVATVAGVLALQQGFETLYSENGRTDLGVFLRPGATNEGDSMFSRQRGTNLIKTIPEIEQNAAGEPLGSLECYLAVRRFKISGGETNVPVRGVQQKTFEIRGEELKIVDGRNFEAGADEVIIGKRLQGRIRACDLGDVITFNTTPFRVVGTFESEGPFESEIWGDLDRILTALERPAPNRVLAKLRDESEAGITALGERLSEHKEYPAKVESERTYLSKQTQMISAMLIVLSTFLGVIMGTAAVFTATNTMLSALASRTHEIGILLASGFGPVPIFLSFLAESLLLCLMGGLVGCMLAFGINGIETSTTNFQTFTEVVFAFRVTSSVLTTAVLFSLVLGLVAGAWPAWRAARLSPTEALRRR
jgi:putative ABC transport system permease protein